MRYVLLLICLWGLRAYGQGDSLKIVTLIGKAYQWHNREIINEQGFEPLKAHTRDTLYAGIDLRSVDLMIGKYRRSGFFDENFLHNYRGLALRMDNELRHKKAVWREGALPPFNHDADPWCDCAYPEGNYWRKIGINQVHITGAHAEVNWTWGKDLVYHVRATKVNGLWKISYLEGYDAKRYHWSD